VYDFEENNNWLYAAGLFNRNASGACFSNVARIQYRKSGAWWQQVDGGCDGYIRDLLFDGNLLYATGNFQYCGLNTGSYNGNRVRGRVPTSYIAVINVGETPMSWRNLGSGLDGIGYAMAKRGFDLFVGGLFNSAGGKLQTNGIARWNQGHWYDVVAKCRGLCDRPVNVFPYINNGDAPTPVQRRPTNCLQLRAYDGNVYCADGGSTLAVFSIDTWRQASTGTNANIVIQGIQNSLISRNGTIGNRISVPVAATTSANGNYYKTFDVNFYEVAPSYTGFSNPPWAMGSSSTITFSALLIFALAFLFF